jgi:hypothetical protein
MAITFHCDYCGKKIEAQDSASGKWAKCPSCHNKIYVPNLNIEDELKLAPIDKSEEEKKRQLMAETYQLTQQILQEKEVPEESAKKPEAEEQPELSERDLTKYVIVYLRQMADGELTEAKELLKQLKPQGTQALKIIDRIAVSDMPEPELADIPQQVLAGLLRALRGQIG